jgi:hypothetical protein
LGGAADGFLRVGFIGFMMTNGTTSGSPDFPMTGHVTCHSADDSALDASLSLSCIGECEAENGGANY